MTLQFRQDKSFWGCFTEQAALSSVNISVWYPEATVQKCLNCDTLQARNFFYLSSFLHSSHPHWWVCYCIASHSVYMLLIDTKNQFQSQKDQRPSTVCLRISIVKMYTWKWKTLHKSNSRKPPKASRVTGFWQLLSALRLSALLCISSLSVKLAFFSLFLPRKFQWTWTLYSPTKLSWASMKCPLQLEDAFPHAKVRFDAYAPFSRATSAEFLLVHQMWKQIKNTFLRLGVKKCFSSTPR